MGRVTARPARPARVTRRDESDVLDLGVRMPTAGDHVTLYSLDEAAPWLKLAANTLRGKINSGQIPARFVTRIGGVARSKTFLSGDQIVSLLLYWRTRTAETMSPPPPRTRTSRRANKIPTSTSRAAAPT